MRSTSFSIVVVVGSVVGSVAAHADDEIVWSGSLATRVQATAVKTETTTSTRDVPILHTLAEANLQSRAKGFDKRLSLVADVSLFAQHGFFFVDGDAYVFDHDVAEDHALVVISELSVRAEILEHLDLTIGKQRVVWGSGIANNPTDVINPPRDPTDPSFQRAGTWQVKLDVPLENLTWSAFFAPTVLKSEVGVPTAMFAFPSYAIGGVRDDNLHWSAGARLYVLVADTDLNLWAVFSNKDGLNDATGDSSAFVEKTRLMASVSRLVGDEVEVHGELLLQTGTTRVYAGEECVDDDEALVGCALARKLPLSRARIDDETVLPRLLLGARWMPADESTLTVEYLYAADGYDDDELGALFQLQTLARDRRRKGQPVPSLASTTTDGLPARTAVDVLRKHTLFVNYTKPRVFDDFTVGAGAVVAPEDLSGLVNANLTWSAREWLQLQAFVFVPVPSLPRLLGDDHVFVFSAPVVSDVSGTVITGANDAVPFDVRAVVEARVFF